MRSCWDADPFNRPPFRKVVEQIEQQLSDTTKHVGLTLVTPFNFCLLVKDKMPSKYLHKFKQYVTED